MIGVIGCLMTESGKQIKGEMLQALACHNLFPVEQEPPGKLAEYPALYYAIQMALDTKSPILYVHTKGAANSIPFIPPIPGRKSIPDFMPFGATLRDWQPTVRKMWYHEFTGCKLNEYITVVSTDMPMVACPFTGKGKATWLNGFIMNCSAAQELYKIFKYTDNGKCRTCTNFTLILNRRKERSQIHLCRKICKEVKARQFLKFIN